MNCLPQVSILILTYNPDNNQLRRTLTAAVQQQEVCFEIIVSDDGSTKSDLSWLPSFFREHGIEDYQILENKPNKGTVQNCLSAVRAAKGEYIFLTSPGDYIYDGFAMRDFYRFAKTRGAELCFGNTVFYRNEEGTPRLTRTFGTPASPQIYASASSLAKASFFCGNWIIGASYFRQRQFALTYLERIAETSVYTEDTTSTLFALADGIRLHYFDRNIVWYEDGTGVSAGNNDKWNRLLSQDAVNTVIKLKHIHPKDPYVDTVFYNLTQPTRWKRIAYKLLRHPFIFLQSLWSNHMVKKMPVFCPAKDMHRLETMLSE